MALVCKDSHDWKIVNTYKILSFIHKYHWKKLNKNIFKCIKFTNIFVFLKREKIYNLYKMICEVFKRSVLPRILRQIYNKINLLYSLILIMSHHKKMW